MRRIHRPAERTAALTALFVGLSTAGAIGALPAHAAGTTTLYVRSSGGNPGECSLAHPCGKIQDAVDEAAKRTGAVIIDIGPGTFDPDPSSPGVVVGATPADKETGLTFRGAGFGRTTLTTPTNGALASSGYLLRAGIVVGNITTGSFPGYPVSVTGLTIAGSPAPDADADGSPDPDGSFNAGIYDISGAGLTLTDVVIRDLTGGAGTQDNGGSTLGITLGSGSAAGVYHLDLSGGGAGGVTAPTSINRTVIARLRGGDAGAADSANPAGTGGGAIGVIGSSVTLRATKIFVLRGGAGGDGFFGSNANNGDDGGLGGGAIGVVDLEGGRTAVTDTAISRLRGGAGGNGGDADNTGGDGGDGGVAGAAAGVLGAVFNLAVNNSEVSKISGGAAGHGGQGWGAGNTGGIGGWGSEAFGVLGVQLSTVASSAEPIEPAHVANLTITGLHAPTSGAGGNGVSGADGGAGGIGPDVAGVVLAGTSTLGGGGAGIPFNNAPTATHLTITDLSDDGTGAGGTVSDAHATAGAQGQTAGGSGAVVVIGVSDPVDLHLAASLLNAGGEPDCAVTGSGALSGGGGGPAGAAVLITDDGYNVTSDNTCGAGPGSFTLTPEQFAASLGKLADNGGLVTLGPTGAFARHTRTMALSPNSRAADAVSAVHGNCAHDDQIGQARPGLGAPDSCAAGAFEPAQVSCGTLSPVRHCEAGAGRD